MCCVVEVHGGGGLQLMHTRTHVLTTHKTSTQTDRRIRHEREEGEKVADMKGRRKRGASDELPPRVSD